MKKSIYYPFSFLVISLLLVVFSCNKDQPVLKNINDQNIQDEHTILFSQGINPANSNNLYDTIGLIHNLSLDSFAFHRNL